MRKLAAWLWLCVFSLGLIPSVVTCMSALEAKAVVPDLSAGKEIFESRCATCHGMDGGGARGPSLRSAKLEKAPDDEALRRVILNGIPPGMPSGWYFTQEEVANVAGYVRSLGMVAEKPVPGDPVHGAVVYAHSGCTACHILAGKGNGFGPDLTSIGTQLSADRLRETIRNPDRALPDDFMYVIATTANGRALRGIRLNEDSFSIQFKDLTGKIYSLRKDELNSLTKRHEKTPMPSFESILSDSDTTDLVAYLASLRGRK